MIHLGRLGWESVTRADGMNISIYTCIRVCVHVCVCMYIYIYIYMQFYLGYRALTLLIGCLVFLCLATVKLIPENVGTPLRTNMLNIQT